MRVAVTGTEGFTGRYLIKELDQRGVEWVSLRADLTDRPAILAECEGKTFDRLIHLAGIAFAALNDWRPYYDVNLIGSLNLLDAVSRTQRDCRCILASTASVYGPAAEGRLSEDHPPSPYGHYACSKLAMEHGAAQWRSRLETVVVRPFNYTGVGQEERFLIPKIVAHCARDADVIELGNLHVRRDFGDVRHVVQAYADMLTAPCLPPTLNVATGQVHSVSDVLEMLAIRTGWRPEVRVNPAFVRADEPETISGSTSALRGALPHWAPIDFGDTLDWMIAANASS